MFVWVCSADVVLVLSPSLQETVICAGNRIGHIVELFVPPGIRTPTGGGFSKPETSTHNLVVLLFLNTNVPVKRCAQPKHRRQNIKLRLMIGVRI
jgi:hypothetical protein